MHCPQSFLIAMVYFWKEILPPLTNLFAILFKWHDMMILWGCPLSSILQRFIGKSQLSPSSKQLILLYDCASLQSNTISILCSKVTYDIAMSARCQDSSLIPDYLWSMKLSHQHYPDLFNNDLMSETQKSRFLIRLVCLTICYWTMN